MKVKIDRAKCIGLGNCVAIAPGAFALDADHKVYIVDAKSEDEETLQSAAESCPVNAIIIEDDAGNQLYP